MSLPRIVEDWIVLIRDCRGRERAMWIGLSVLCVAAIGLDVYLVADRIATHRLTWQEACAAAATALALTRKLNRPMTDKIMRGCRRLRAHTLRRTP